MSISESLATQSFIPATHRETIIWRVSTLIAGYALLAMGCITLVCWIIGSPELIQFHPALMPLHYNAGIGLLIWGGGFLAVAHHFNRLACVLGCALVAVMIANLALTICGGDLHLDQWLVRCNCANTPYPATGITLGLSTALGFGGIGLILLTGQVHFRHANLVCSLLGTFYLTGMISLLLTTHYHQWATSFISRPSAFCVIGFALGGLAFSTASIRHGHSAQTLGLILPLSVCCGGIIATIVVWHVLGEDQDRRIFQRIQFETADVRKQAQDQLQALFEHLTRLSQNWKAENPEQNRLDVGNFVGSVPSCMGVARIDSDLKLHWVETRGLVNNTLSLTDLGIDQPLTDAVRQGNQIILRAPRSKWRGQRVLVIYVPHQSYSANGGLLSVYNLTDYLGNLINTNVAMGYAVQVTDHEEPIFNRSTTDDQYRERWQQTLPLNIPGQNWKVTVWPTSESLQRENLQLRPLAFLVGMITTCLVTLAVHLALTARRRAYALEAEVRQRELAQRALSQSEQKYRCLIENLGQAIFLQDHQHRYVAANPQFCKSVGRTEQEIIGATELDLFDPKRASVFAQDVQTVLTDGKSLESEDEIVLNGRKAHVHRILTPVQDATGQVTGVLGICWDVTQQRQLEAHVHQANKMDAIGQLAGGIAHDFNNLLTVILGNLELLLNTLPPTGHQYELTQYAHQAATRAASLTQRLLGFSRRHQLDWTPTNLNTIVEEVVSLLRRTIDPLIEIETQTDPQLWPVLADPAQINQILMNLCLNARDAIDIPGRILIETCCVSASELSTNHQVKGQTGDVVRLSVSDTGRGMTEDVKARIYEPFFTTKEVGKGTGLGLSMVFAIVRQHKGWIECWSEVGQGTRFDIFLPRCERSLTVKQDSTDSLPTPGPREKRTILVVDDEELIRRLASMTLSAAGYTVIEATDGQQALEIYQHEWERIDLVLLDLTMPALSGHDAFRHLLKLNPQVRVVFASGYAAEQLSDEEKQQMAGFVKKPYRPGDLLTAVEEALAKCTHFQSSVSEPDTLHLEHLVV